MAARSMKEDEIREQRWRLYTEKGLTVSLDHDKILVTIFTGIIAGLVALVVSGKVGPASGTLFLAATGIAVLGLGFCVLHMAYIGRSVYLQAAQVAGEKEVDNIIGGKDPTDAVLAHNRSFAQMCFSRQLVCLFLSVAFAALGFACLFYVHVGLWGLLIAGIVVAAVGSSCIRAMAIKSDHAPLSPPRMPPTS